MICLGIWGFGDLLLFFVICLAIWGFVFFSRFVWRFWDLGICFAICLEIWGFVFSSRDVCGDLGSRDFFVRGSVGEFCFFHVLFGDLGICFSRFVCGFVFLFVAMCLWIWGFVFFVICLGICGFNFRSRFVWRFGDLALFFFRDLFRDFGIWRFVVICLWIWGFGDFVFFSRFVWGFVFFS